MELIGQTLGPYRILAHIAAGGMSDVYRAVNERVGREVALKVLPRESRGDRESLARFRRECRILASLRHPGIMEIYDCDYIEGVYFYAMRLLTEPTLESILESPRAEHGRLPTTEALEITLALLDALEAVHAAGVIHRDIKPTNIFVGSDGGVILSDFGVARHDREQTTITHGGTVGTYLYMAPEQIDGVTADARADLYAVGLMLYRMVCGKLPFGDQISAIVQAKTLQESLPLASSQNPGVPRALDGILSRACARVPSRRYPDAGSLAAALRGLLPDQVPAPSRFLPMASSPGPEPRARLLRKAPILVLASGILLGVVLFPRGKQPGSGHEARIDPPGEAAVLSSCSMPATSAPSPGTAPHKRTALQDSRSALRRLWPGYIPSREENRVWEIMCQGDPGVAAGEAELKGILRQLGRERGAGFFRDCFERGLLWFRIANLLGLPPDPGASSARKDPSSFFPVAAAPILRLLLLSLESTTTLMQEYRAGPRPVLGVTVFDARLTLGYLLLFQKDLHPTSRGAIEALFPRNPQASLEKLSSAPEVLRVLGRVDALMLSFASGLTGAPGKTGPSALLRRLYPGRRSGVGEAELSGAGSKSLPGNAPDGPGFKSFLVGRLRLVGIKDLERLVETDLVPRDVWGLIDPRQRSPLGQLLDEASLLERFRELIAGGLDLIARRRRGETAVGPRSYPALRRTLGYLFLCDDSLRERSLPALLKLAGVRADEGPFRRTMTDRTTGLDPEKMRRLLDEVDGVLCDQFRPQSPVKGGS